MLVHYSKNANTANHLLFFLLAPTNCVHNCVYVCSRTSAELNKLYWNLFGKCSLYFAYLARYLSIFNWRSCGISSNSSKCNTLAIVVMPKSHWIVKELPKNKKIWMHNCAASAGARDCSLATWNQMKKKENNTNRGKSKQKALKELFVPSPVCSIRHILFYWQMNEWIGRSVVFIRMMMMMKKTQIRGIPPLTTTHTTQSCEIGQNGLNYDKIRTKWKRHTANDQKNEEGREKRSQNRETTKKRESIDKEIKREGEREST